MIKAKPWDGKGLKGTWEVTLKIDGVRALLVDGKWMSRADKPLYNIPPWRPGMPTDCEVYLDEQYGDQKGRFKATIRAVRTQTLKSQDGCKLKRCKCLPSQPTCPNWGIATPAIKPEHLYSLDPLDDRLKGLSAPPGGPWKYLVDPDAKLIRLLLGRATSQGYEGLVLRQKEWVGPDGPHTETWLKVKPMETHDVLITGAIEGVGKHKGRLGALMTAKGKVGTGFSDEERRELWKQHNEMRDRRPAVALGHLGATSPLIGQTIEVSCMSFTPDGKFRHPRFVRMRPDKIAAE